MALSVANLQSNLAYRLGETAGQASTSSTGGIRLEWLNMAYFDIARRHNWWWLEGSDTSNTNTGSATGYAEPTDLKEFVELKIGNIYYDFIPYQENRIYTGTTVIVSIPTSIRAYKAYRYAGRYYLTPVDGNDAATHNIKYFKRVTKRTVDSDTFLMPDEYLEALTAFAEARYWTSITQQTKASVPFQEYEQIIKQMEQEQGRRGWGSPGYSILEPEQSMGFIR